MSERVQITFPIHVVLGGRHAGRTGELHAVTFVNGVSTVALAYHEAKRLALAEEVHDLLSGVRVHPITEKREWSAEERSKFWNRLRPLAAAKRREARLACFVGEGLSRLAEEDVPFAEALGQAREWATMQLEAEEAETAATLERNAQEGASEPVLAPVAAKGIEAAAEAEKASETPDSAGNEVSAPERGDDERRLAVLRAALQLRGARTLRDAAKAAGVEAARSGQELVSALAASGLPLSELRKLAEDVRGE